MAKNRLKPASSSARAKEAPSAWEPRRGHARTLAETLRKLTKSLCARQGFAQAEVVTRWRDIVGPALADHCLPERLAFPHQGDGPGTLHVAAGGAFALELQHLSPQLIERINGYFGFPAVARVAIRQAPVSLLKRGRKAPLLALSAAEKAALGSLVEPVKDETLKAALARLGAAVMAER